MSLSDIYYYFIAFSMMAGVKIASALHLNIDQKPNERIYIGFGSPNLEDSYKEKEKL
jgi:hypothetical protein